MTSDLLTDAELELVLEGKTTEAVAVLRLRIGAGLVSAHGAVRAAEEELGLMHDEECTACSGRGTIRVRKPEYRPKAPQR